MKKQNNAKTEWYKRFNWIYVILFIYVMIYIIHLIQRYHFVLWDEAVYIGIGKYIWSAGNIGLWEEIRPLGLTFLFGAVWKLGFNPVIWDSYTNRISIVVYF